jgi:hypothetical protein
LIAIEFCRGPADGTKDVRKGRLEVRLDSTFPPSVEMSGGTYLLTEIRFYVGTNTGKVIYTLAQAQD